MHYTVCGVTKSQTRLSDFHFASLRCYASRQAPLSMGFSRQEYWSGLPCPPPGDLPNLGMEPRSPALQSRTLKSASLKSGALAGRFFTSGAPWEILRRLLYLDFINSIHKSGKFSQGTQCSLRPLFGQVLPLFLVPPFLSCPTSFLPSLALVFRTK